MSVKHLILEEVERHRLSVFRIILFLIIVYLIITLFFVVWYIPEKVVDKDYAETCLPDVNDNLQCRPTEVRLESFLDDTLRSKYNQIKLEKKKIRDDYIKRHNVSAASSSAYDGSRLAMRPAAKLFGRRLTGSDPNSTHRWYSLKWSARVDDSENTDVPNAGCSCRQNGKKRKKRRCPCDVPVKYREGFLSFGVREYKGRLVVPISGNYYVYSFVEFREGCILGNGTPNAIDITAPVEHALFKYSVIGDKNVELVRNAQPRKVALNLYENVYNSHISTLVELRAGDELSVQVSNASLFTNVDDSYFGVALI